LIHSVRHGDIIEYHNAPTNCSRLYTVAEFPKSEDEASIIGGASPNAIALIEQGFIRGTIEQTADPAKKPHVVNPGCDNPACRNNDCKGECET
jgi:hypothetical protein